MAVKKSNSEWEKMFKSADKDNSGTLDVLELRNLLRQGNSQMSDAQIADAFILFDGPRGDRRITLDEFITGLNNLRDFMTKLAAFFKQYDTDNSGFLDKNELKKILCSCGKNYTEAEVKEILSKADKSGDGQISFPEFIDACT